MTALLTYNLPLLAGAPNGIKKLRELILELAVRGKLVAQDPSDEPASELLKYIAEDKARLVDEGKIKKQKDLADVPEPVILFPLPAGWAATSIGEATICRDGERIPVSQAEREGRDKVFDYYGASGVIDKIDGYLFDKPLLLVGEDGANLINRSTPIAFMARGQYWVNNHAHVLDGISEELLLYIELYFNAIDLKPYVTGTAQPKMNQSKMNGIPVGLPPVAEQHRIVTKVDELMALCDRLEAQQTDSESAHAQLVQALLDSLTQASETTDFATNWQRLAEHFHTLFTTEPSIDALKQTLLQLAVMGKLVPQDPNDESASEFVRRIQAEKKRYLTKSNARKQKDLAADLRPEPPFDVPAGWEWQTVDDVLHVTGGITLGRKLGGRKLLSKPYLRVANVQRGRLEMERIKEVEVPEDEVEKYLLRNGDLLITEGGDWDKVGRTAIWRDELPECLHQNHVFRARAVVTDWEPCWAEMYLNSAPAREYFAGSSKQTTNLASINMTQLRACAFPLPPLAEQQRIVAKVDQIMALCDQLKTSLTQARQLNAQLACTLVERSLAEDSQQGPKATDRQVARTLLAAEVTHRLHSQRTFGQRKLQKVIYLAEHVARLNAIQGDYLRDAAGPHDRQLMTKVEAELKNHQWYERFERETIGHAYRPLSQAGRHRQAYSSAWSVAERATIEQVIELMQDWDTDHCEMTVTLYAAWNDFILEGRPVSDDAIVDEVMHSWNDTKLRFGKTEWLAILAEMKKHKILIPTGFGKRTTGGMLSLPGFE
ncbi:restriction endonuclease subunit S [Pseudomonas gingeri]|uniref:Restriction endonuclease subunit S n=1 Tax=Pseudomonas gingeri TaxID=117681 RepID=A0A7Y7YGP8_9PSED|nr:restriction endonuclease subunit S [Pseudomonas gingeri]NWB32051.1 restriction endonuclease subunit S [Pseudomonas gingeri]NWC36191.1 restriction endonuclease subunit S [Pseudomonas gingeri]